jgi:hypothetical protein
LGGSGFFFLQLLELVGYLLGFEPFIADLGCFQAGCGFKGGELVVKPGQFGAFIVEIGSGYVVG